MQLNLLALDGLLGIQHILNQLTIRSTCRVYSDDALRLILTLLVGSLLLQILLVAVECGLACLVCSHHRSRKNLVDIIRHRLVRGRMTNDIK